jgi:2-iminobutanoate/2-iminopropanoate deaminase
VLEYITLPNGTLPPLGPFPHAVRAGDFLFVTGQLAEDPETSEVIAGPIDEQVRRVMDNLKLVLEHAGTSFNQVVMARVFITDLRYMESVNKIYSSYFEAGRLPGRTTIGVVGLAGLGDVEIDLIVYCGLTQ